MSALRQIIAVSMMNLRTLPQRLGSSTVIVVGMAAVVAVVTGVLSMSSGFMDTVNKTGSPQRAIVTTSGALTEAQSNLPRDEIPTIVNAVGIKRTPEDKPIASADMFASWPMTRKDGEGSGGVWLHGAGPEVFTLLPQLKLLSGRLYQPGLHELMVGRLLPLEYRGLELGDRVSLPGGEWTIVGVYGSDGDSHEAELLGDAETLLSAYRQSYFSSVTVALQSPSAFDQFKAALTTNPALSVDVIRENEYYAKLSKPLNDFLTLVAYAVGGIMGLGAAFGAVNTLYSSVSTRSREIATLRAIGFGAAPIVISVLAEALLLSLLGATAGAALAWLAFNGNVMLGGWAVYTTAVKPALLVSGVLAGVALGMLGGLFPALRAGLMPVSTALRAI